jgi:hypothetical protein
MFNMLGGCTTEHCPGNEPEQLYARTGFMDRRKLPGSGIIVGTPSG